MYNKTTSHLGLLLPHEQNELEDDVLRIIAAFRQIDDFAKATDAALAARLEQAVAADDTLATLLLRSSAAEQAQGVLDAVQTGHGQTLLAHAAQITALQQRSFFGVCDTAGDEAAKHLSLPGFALAPGVTLDIIFETVNAAEDITLAVNEGEAVPVLVSGVAPEPGNLAKGQIYTLKFSGSAWQIMAGMAEDRIGQTAWFEDTRPRPGYVPLNGCTIEDFSAQWPQMAVYLATEYGQERCFESLAEREAAHVAVWATLASGATVGWNGLGGVTRFFWDQEEDILYMPDLRGMIRTMAGDGVVAPNMGEGMGDRIREISAAATSSRIWRHPNLSGAFCDPNPSLYWKKPSDEAGGYPVGNLYFSASRVVSTGATNTPRSWGSLASAFIGQRGA